MRALSRKTKMPDSNVGFLFRAWPTPHLLTKRGWRDEASADLQGAKERSGWADRGDIQTWVNLHDAEEARTPGSFSSR
jgi:hypothetical protein